jgi:hypothetical protein
MADLLDLIEAKLKELIEGMTIAGGYNYDWGTVNSTDEANADYPLCNIIQGDEENVDDDAGGASTQSYDNIAFYDLVCKSQNQSTLPDPNFSIHSEFNKMSHDIKKLFGTQPNCQLEGLAENVEYLGKTPKFHRSGDIFRAGDITIRIRVKYSQDRLEPNNLAG